MKILMLAVLAVCFAVAAVPAFAGTDTYCDRCSIGNVPAVSYFAKFTSNHSSTFQKKKQQIYYYNYGTQECNAYSYVQVFGLNITCNTIWDYTTARCHLLNDGTVVAICWADFTGGIPTRARFLASSGLATSAPGNPFAGIAKANHAPTSADAVDAETAASLRREDATGATPQIGLHVLGESRKLGRLPSGEKVHLVPTSMSRLCVVVARTSESCGDPLSRTSPISFVVVDQDGAAGAAPTAYGVAQDGVRAVSFTVAGKSEAVDVHDNFFVFRATGADASGEFSTPTATFVDGTTLVAR